MVYYNCIFKEFERQRALADKKTADDIDKFIARNRNIDFSSPLAKEKADKQAWQEAYINRMIMLAGKFTFPDAKVLEPLDPDVKDSDPSILKLTDVRFNYDEKAGLPWIFDTPINIDIKLSTRLGIMGPNGAGKSTLLKLLTDRLKPVSGTRTIHPTADVAYFAQHHAAEMNLTQTPMEYMVSQFPEIPNSGLLRKHLGKVGILGTKADTRMTSLSGGQRSCVVFARITYYCPHLLILDEPTNFLDLDSVDSLITATSKYKGALLIVSHSRAFLNKCARAFLSVVPGRFEMFNDLKSCEKATYTFIQELESGTSAGKLGAAALRKKEAAVAGPSDGSVTISISSVPRTVAKAVVEVKEVKEVKAAPSRNGGGQNSLGHCPKWVKTGECALAERCRFMHDPSKVPGAAPAPAPVDQKAGGRGGPKPQRGGGRGGQRGGQSQRGGGQQRGGRGGARR